MRRWTPQERRPRPGWTRPSTAARPCRRRRAWRRQDAWRVTTAGLDPALFDDTIERVNITLPKRVLRRLDDLAAARHQSRGPFIADLTMSTPDDRPTLQRGSVQDADHVRRRGLEGGGPEKPT